MGRTKIDHLYFYFWFHKSIKKYIFSIHKTEKVDKTPEKWAKIR